MVSEKRMKLTHLKCANGAFTMKKEVFFPIVYEKKKLQRCWKTEQIIHCYYCASVWHIITIQENLQCDYRDLFAILGISCLVFHVQTPLGHVQQPSTLPGFSVHRQQMMSRLYYTFFLLWIHGTYRWSVYNIPLYLTCMSTVLTPNMWEKRSPQIIHTIHDGTLQMKWPQWKFRCWTWLLYELRIVKGQHVCLVILPCYIFDGWKVTLLNPSFC